MINLISPKQSFADFCQRMLGKDPLEVLSAASAEISYARINHREKTKEREFRKGSRGRIYSDNLQHFVYAIINGEVPDGVSPEFCDAAKPLALDLLRKATGPPQEGSGRGQRRRLSGDLGSIRRRRRCADVGRYTYLGDRRQPAGTGRGSQPQKL